MDTDGMIVLEGDITEEDVKRIKKEWGVKWVELTGGEARNAERKHNIELEEASLVSRHGLSFDSCLPSAPRISVENLIHIWNTIVDRVHDVWHVLRYGYVDDCW